MRAGLLAICACSTPPASVAVIDHSSSIIASGDRVFVVNPDLDSVSVIDASTRAVVKAVSLGTPLLDAGQFTPSVMPRAIAISPDGATLYVTGMRSSSVYAIDVASSRVTSAVVGSEPVGILVEEGAVYVACSQDNTIVRLDPSSLAITARVQVANEPWALAWSAGTLVVTHFLQPEISMIDPASLAVTTVAIPATDPRGDARLAHGQPRGLYDVAARPNSSELWVVHVMLGIDTPQPALDFESTVFPSLSVVRDGAYANTLSIDAADVPGIDGSFGDIVSGPHAIAFTHDGAFALVVDINSEDVLAIDAANQVEAALLRPLPGHMPEGIALSEDESVAFIDERNTGEVAIVRVDRTADRIALAVDGVVARGGDAMPADLRLGQHLFYSANSDEFPITRNHWVACASCHLEGRSDAVTWKFAQGPRDTPTNAGGMNGTGFLFRTADRKRVQDYWHTVDIEQGGRFDPTAQAALLDPLAAFVNFGIPAPIPPTTDPTLVARGLELFTDPSVGCSGCHGGGRFTDSGDGNDALDLGGTILLHDVGTCVTSDYADVAHVDIEGHPREACRFDTPSLTGVASSPPYLHDGSAATLRDVLELTRGRMGDITSLSDADETALIEYLRSL
jgi:YVTN family beta-propeller protein